MRKNSAVAMALAAASLSLSVRAASSERTTVLGPSSAWVLDYAEERCRLIRFFGTEPGRVTLQIDSFGRHNDFRFTISGPPVPSTREAIGELRYRLTPDEIPRDEVTTLEGTVGDSSATSFSLDFGPAFDSGQFEDMTPDEIAAFFRQRLSLFAPFREKIESIEVVFGTSESVKLKLGRMAAPLGALGDCIDDLQRHWGFDPDQLRSLSRQPVAKPSTVRRMQRRYPVNMVAGGKSAYVPVRVMVDVDGSASDCVVQLDSVEEAFEEAVCDGLAREFEPALDAQGNPVASVFQTDVIYRLN